MRGLGISRLNAVFLQFAEEVFFPDKVNMPN